jgi:hypothetical protein
VRRYSKLPHLWSLSKKLAGWLEASKPGSASGPTIRAPHVYKLSQRLSDETVSALVREFQTGASLAELQRMYTLGRGSVQRLLRKAGVRRRRKSLTDVEVASLVERYESG